MSHDVAFLDVLPRVVQETILQELPEGLKIAFAESYELPEQLGLAQASEFLVSGWAPVPARYIEDSPRLKLIHKWGTGYEKIDLEAARAKGVSVAITAGTNAVAVAEHVVAMLLAILRRMTSADRSIRQGHWPKAELLVETQMLAGKTVGILGFGHVGRALARILKGFGVGLLCHNRSRPSHASLDEVGARHVGFASLLKQSDVISVHLPLAAETRGLLDRVAFAQMKRGVVLINTARGGIVDESALVDAIRFGRVSGAGIDVFEQEPLPMDSRLFALDSVVMTPHTASTVLDNVPQMASHVFGNLGRFVRGEALEPEDVILP